MSIFKACDIRGVFGEEWNEHDALRIGLALSALLRGRNQRTMCVGGDFRRSTPGVMRALSEGLRRGGIHVVQVGQLPTPAVYFAARHGGYRNVAVVTASHNPARYNGIKFLMAGEPAVSETVAELVTQLDQPLPDTRRGDLQHRDVRDLYEDWVTKAAQQLLAASPCSDGRNLADRRREPPAKNGPRQRVVLDAMSGAFTEIAPRVLHAAGYDVVRCADRIDPDFAGRSPNPANDANLEDLLSRVIRTKADVGIALDGDGDRVIFVRHDGQIVRPEQIAALFTQECFVQPTVVFDLKCASIVPQLVRRAGGTPIMRPSGYGFIKQTMVDRQAEMGVEVSGHHFFGCLDGGDDGLFTALVLLGLLDRTGRSLTELIEPIGWPCITPDLRVAWDGDATETVRQIASSCAGDVTLIDGVRAEYADGWALARASITEPAITLRFEGTSYARMRAIAESFLAGVPQLRPKILEMIDE